MVTVSEKQEAAGTTALPPAYTAKDSGSSPPPEDVPTPSSAASSSSPPGPIITLTQPTNFLTISRTNQSIKGTYTIDPSMKMPPGAIPSIGQDQKPLNMRLASQNGSIDAIVEIVRGTGAKGPARLEVNSMNGSVTLTLHDKTQNHFRLHAISENGSISLRLPSGFTGTLSSMLVHGKLVFSAAVQARLVTFSEDGNEGRFFIGDYASSGYEDEETWLGDHLRVEAKHGKVRIDWSDERVDVLNETRSSNERKGFFAKLLG